jgi:hypothetical protein
VTSEKGWRDDPKVMGWRDEGKEPYKPLVLSPETLERQRRRQERKQKRQWLEERRRLERLPDLRFITDPTALNVAKQEITEAKRKAESDYRRAHPQIMERAAKRREANREKARLDAWRRYGVASPDEALKLWTEASSCKICGIHVEGFHKTLDHDHKTGRIRGVLCRKCNTVLGLVSDDSGRLRKLADYIDEASNPMVIP